jgi:hypothetical protein
MAVFTVSDNTITILRKKGIRRVILIVTISMIIWGSLAAFVLFNAKLNIDIEVYIITASITLILIFFVVFFSVKRSLGIFSKEMKSIQYVIENERLIIRKSDFEQFNITKSEIQCINKYKNNTIIIILKTNQKITVDKYLNDFDQLMENLNKLFTINNINKNPSILKKIVTNIIQVIIVFTLFISNNIIIVFLTGLVAIIYCMNNYFDESIDLKRRKSSLVSMIIIVILRLIRFIL